MKNNPDSFQRARDYAFLLLKFRLRSEKELYERLKRKKFQEQEITATLAFLKNRGFIDDKTFTKVWIDSRLKKPLGPRRIKEELKLKGINGQTIDFQLNEARKGYLEESVVSDLARARLSRIKNVEPQTAKRRLYAYLLRRGFSPEIIMDVIDNLCKRKF